MAEGIVYQGIITKGQGREYEAGSEKKSGKAYPRMGAWYRLQEANLLLPCHSHIFLIVDSYP